jgi:hypothetical protein
MMKWPAMISWARQSLLQPLARYGVPVRSKRTFAV